MTIRLKRVMNGWILNYDPSREPYTVEMIRPDIIERVFSYDCNDEKDDVWENVLQSISEIIGEKTSIERLIQSRKKIERLAQYIMEHVPGEPSQDQGAVDTVIRLLNGKS